MEAAEAPGAGVRVGAPAVPSRVASATWFICASVCASVPLSVKWVLYLESPPQDHGVLNCPFRFA